MLLLLGAFFSLSHSTALWAANAEPVGTIKVVDGQADVMILNPANGGQRTAKQSAPVFAEDKIVTAAGQTVILDLSEKSEIVIAPQSSFKIESYKSGERQQSVFSLFYGTVRALVRKAYSADETFAVKTGSSVMGVRGTEFVVAIDKTTQATEVFTMHGAVAMAKTMDALRDAKQFVLVSAGQTSSMDKGAAMPAAAKKFDQAVLHQRLQKISNSFDRAVGPVNEAATSHIRPGQSAIGNLKADREDEQAKEKKKRTKATIDGMETAYQDEEKNDENVNADERMKHHRHHHHHHASAGTEPGSNETGAAPGTEPPGATDTVESAKKTVSDSTGRTLRGGPHAPSIHKIGGGGGGGGSVGGVVKPPAQIIKLAPK